MVKNYFKTAWRTVVKDRTYATINILGLTIGLAACMLVLTVVMDELSYDKSWNRSADLYLVYKQQEMAVGAYQRSPHTPEALGAALKHDLPDLAQFASMGINEKRLRLDEGNPDGISVSLLTIDTNALSMLDFIPVEGRLPTYVAGKTNLLITESFRDRYFKAEDPVGKTIEDVPSWSDEAQQLLITGVIKDLPKNTHLRADVVALYPPTTETLSISGLWGGKTVYYLLKQGVDPLDFTQKMNKWVQHYVADAEEKPPVFGLQPIHEVYLSSDYDRGIQVQGNRSTLNILTATGILLLAIACINFVNLSTARSIKRLKETGVRKILGAGQTQLIFQFLAESLLFFAIGLVLAFMLYVTALPILERFVGHGLTFSLLGNFSYLILSVLTVLAISLIIGIYPAWLFSALKPSNSLKGKLFQSHSLDTGYIRKALVIVQFSLAIVVLISLLVVQRQNQLMLHKDLGYQKENLLYIGMRQWGDQGETFKQELKRLPGIEEVSMARWDPVDGIPTFYDSPDNPLLPREKIEVSFILADFDFMKTLGFTLKEGRPLDPMRESDNFDMEATFRMSAEENKTYNASRAALITESTASLLGFDKPGTHSDKIGFPVVGILKDFHRESLHKALSPVFILAQQDLGYARLFIRTTPGMEQQAQASLAKAWKMFYPNRLMDAQWVSDILAKHYTAEKKQQILLTLFGALMVFLSATGIFGLIVHATQQRTKEIGIRKVLGASVAGIVRMFSAGFVKLVFIAAVIASPVAWWAMNRWLEDFAYRIDIEWWMFVLAGLAAVTIALLTVGTQSIRAATANPADSLRDE